MPRREDLQGNAPVVILVAALLVSSALLLVLGSGTTFFQDAWAFLLERRGDSAHDFLRPHNEHISVIPVAIEKLLEAVFGLESAAPERVVLTAMLSATAALVFVYVRRRLGAWLALIAAVLLLFLGSAWEVLLWPFEMSLVGSVITGVAMLLALDRNDRRGDAAACVLLVISIGFSSLGVTFAVGAGVDVFLRRGARGLRRIYIPAAPLFLYAIWYVAYGREAHSGISLHNAVHSPPFMVEGFAASVESTFGLRTIVGGIYDHQRPYLGLAVLLVLIGLFAYWQRRKPEVFQRMRDPGISPRLWPVAASASAFWLFAALNRIPGREATASRYMHIGAVFVLLIAADLFQGARFRRPALIVGAVVAMAAVASNLVPLMEGKDFLDEQSTLTRADLGAIEVARRTVDPSFWLNPEVAGTPSLINVKAGPYLAVTDEFGSPAYTPAELTRAPNFGRRQADIVLAAALPITTETRPSIARRTGPPQGACVDVSGGARSASTGLPLSPGLTRIEIPPGISAGLRLRRFAIGVYPVDLGDVPGDSTTWLEIPRDRSTRPWYLQVEATQTVTVCR